MSLFKRIEYNAPVTLTFSLICLIVLIFYNVFGEGFLYAVAMTYRDSLLNPMMYVRLITHIFGHLGWDHFWKYELYSFAGTDGRRKVWFG